MPAARAAGRGTSSGKRLRVAFVHPDLGLGGAERLIVQAAQELQHRGHSVVIYTAHHDPQRSFVSADGGEVEVRVRGGWLPTQLGQRLGAVCTIVRTGYAALALLLSRQRFDVVVVDLVAHVVPLLRLHRRTPCVFYCHYPDALLAREGGRGYRLYRRAIDALESLGMRSASRVAVNSRYTARSFAEVFGSAAGEPRVVHPGVNLAAERLPGELSPGPATVMSASQEEVHADRAECEVDADRHVGATSSVIDILSVARFERRKNVSLAIEAVARLRSHVSKALFARVHLHVAGGFDERLPDSQETLEYLRDLAAARGVSEQVSFFPSISDAELQSRLSSCTCLVHTSADEHLGIAPLEGMAAGKPVVAVNRAGPLETVVDGSTGYLRDPDPDEFAAAIASLLSDPGLAARMGRAARARVAEHFTLERFGDRFEALLLEATQGEGR